MCPLCTFRCRFPNGCLGNVGRPIGNARTERAIETLKHQEIHLQPFYVSEEEALHQTPFITLKRGSLQKTEG